MADQLWVGGTGVWNQGRWLSAQPGPTDEASFGLPSNVTIVQGESESVAGVDFSTANATLNIEGTLTVGAVAAGSISNGGGFAVRGTINVDGGTLIAGQYVSNPNGLIHLSMGGVYQWNGSGSAVSQSVDMGNDADSFQFSTAYDGAITNFHMGDTIKYLGDVSSIDIGNNVITFNSTNGTSYNINLSGSQYDSSNLVVSGNTVTSEAPVCFAAGTRINTTRGSLPVEDLSANDFAVCASGEHRPIRWLGHRVVDCRRHPAPDTVMPVRIAAGAFGPARPARDLFVSPGHALCVDILGEVLIPAAVLVNGTTIVQIDVDTVTYWHVELDSHDILLAENMPAESYLDMGNKAFFVETNVVSLAALTPDALVTTHADFCRPFLAAGPIVDLVRARLRERAVAAGWRLAERGMEAIHLVADGRIVRPDVDGLSLRFVLPADAADVWLVSEAGVPSQLGVSLDDRRLGLCLSGLSVDDGLAPRRMIAPDDRRLVAGFHESEGGTRRWTSGRARLPATLWEGCRGRFFLRVDLEAAPLPRWSKGLLQLEVAA